MGLIGVSSVKIIKGSKSPLEIHKLKGPEFYCDGDYMGKNGLYNLQIPPPFLTLFWIM